MTTKEISFADYAADMKELAESGASIVQATVAIIRALTPKTYHHDICTRCGHVVKAKSE